jgi:hypothetical protein
VRIVLLHPPPTNTRASRLHARLPGAELVVPPTVPDARSALMGAHASSAGACTAMVLGATAARRSPGWPTTRRWPASAPIGAPVVPVPTGAEDGSRDAAVAALTRFVPTRSSTSRRWRG